MKISQELYNAENGVIQVEDTSIGGKINSAADSVEQKLEEELEYFGNFANPSVSDDEEYFGYDNPLKIAYNFGVEEG